jgi:hypothetical protein
MLRRPLLPLAAVLLVLLSARGAAAQALYTVHGRVWDRAQMAPLRAALVSADEVRARAVTNASGEFTLRLPAGTHLLRVTALGFAPGVLEVTAGPDAQPVAIALDSDPVLLERLVVMADRFELRRKTVATPSTVLGRDELTGTSSRHMAEVVGRHTRDGPPLDCGQRTLHLGERGLVCTRAQNTAMRGARARVWIDEVPISPSLEVLQNYDPRDFERVEIYDGGKQIRLYTVRFMERAARIGYEPLPLPM